MAARGSVEKDMLTKHLIEQYPGSFVLDKVVVVPIGDVQIKVSMTCAAAPIANTVPATKTETQSNVTPPTSAELSDVDDFMKLLK